MIMSATAVHLYDHEGEETMLAYLLLANAHPQGQDLFQAAGCCILQDSTLVRRLNRPHPDHPEARAHYCFEWTDPEGDQRREHRPATGATTPPAPGPSITLVAWPHTDAILIALMELARQEAARRLRVPDPRPGPEYDLTTLAAIHLRAPDAREAVNQAIMSDQQPASIMSELENLRDDCAHDAQQSMPEPQFEALVRWAQSQLEKQNKEENTRQR